MKATTKTILIILSMVIGQSPMLLAQKIDPPQKVRTVVTTDGEVDDMDSFIRFLLYVNEFKLEGLVYTSSQWHWKGDGKGTKFTSKLEMSRNIYGERTELRWVGTTWIQKLLDDYEKVQPNLALHASGYPTADELRKLIKVGNINFEGDMAEPTEGSEWIKKLLLDDNPQPIYFQLWGGANTIARALKSIEEEYSGKSNWAAIQDKVSSKAVLYNILDQDVTYRNYISPNWPKVRMYNNFKQFWCVAYAWPTTVPTEYLQYLKGDFMAKNIIEGHGPLMANYFTWGDGKQIPGDPDHNHGTEAEMKKQNRGKFDFISEGDSPSYFHLIDVGLMNLENPEYGGWGGRLVPSSSNPFHWEDKVVDWNTFTQKDDQAFPQTRWVEAIQLDFAARADWCVKPYPEANHPPVIKIKGGNRIMASAGSKLKIKASAKDPDRQKVELKFWQYPEAGNNSGKIYSIDMGKGNGILIIPQTAKKGETIHLIVEGKDAGSPALIRYQRLIVEVR
jgi:hypothetical protein